MFECEFCLYLSTRAPVFEEPLHINARAFEVFLKVSQSVFPSILAISKWLFPRETDRFFEIES